MRASITSIDELPADLAAVTNDAVLASDTLDFAWAAYAAIGHATITP